MQLYLEHSYEALPVRVRLQVSIDRGFMEIE